MKKIMAIIAFLTLTATAAIAQNIDDIRAAESQAAPEAKVEKLEERRNEAARETTNADEATRGVAESRVSYLETQIRQLRSSLASERKGNSKQLAAQKKAVGRLTSDVGSLKASDKAQNGRLDGLDDAVFGKKDPKTKKRSDGLTGRLTNVENALNGYTDAESGEVKKGLAEVLNDVTTVVGKKADKADLAKKADKSDLDGRAYKDEVVKPSRFYWAVIPLYVAVLICGGLILLGRRSGNRRYEEYPKVPESS